MPLSYGLKSCYNGKLYVAYTYQTKNSAFWISGEVIFQNTCLNESSRDVGGTQEAIGILWPRLPRSHLCKAQYIS